jgi:hypothetical protein
LAIKYTHHIAIFGHNNNDGLEENDEKSSITIIIVYIDTWRAREYIWRSDEENIWVFI